MNKKQGLLHFSPLDLQFLLSLCAFGVHPIVLCNLGSPVLLSSLLCYGSAVFLKKEGSKLEPLFSLELEDHGVILTKSLGDAVDNNWDNYIEGYQPVGSRNDYVPQLFARKIADGCFEVSFTPDTGNFVHIDCDEHKLLVYINSMLGKFRGLMEADTDNIIWFSKTFSIVIYKVVSGFQAKDYISSYLPSYITKAFESFNLADLVMIAILLKTITATVSRGRIGAMFVGCFKLPKLLEDNLLAIGECARDWFNYLLFTGMLQVYFIAFASNGGRYSLADPFTIVNLVMAYILLSAAISKRSSRFGLILAGGVILSTVVLICWNILCTVPTTYWRGVATETD